MKNLFILALLFPASMIVASEAQALDQRFYNELSKRMEQQHAQEEKDWDDWKHSPQEAAEGGFFNDLFNGQRKKKASELLRLNIVAFRQIDASNYVGYGSSGETRLEMKMISGVKARNQQDYLMTLYSTTGEAYRQPKFEDGVWTLSVLKKTNRSCVVTIELTKKDKRIYNFEPHCPR